MMNLTERTYIIGRQGNIRLFDNTASARHAELVVLNNTLYLTDLDSTNGTYLVEKGKRRPFKEGYIEPGQTLSFGDQVYSVNELVSAAAQS